jgi:hypothetical protein
VRGLTWGAVWGAVGGAGLVVLLFGLGSWFSAAGPDAATVLSGVLVGVLVGAVLGASALGVALALLVVADRRGRGGQRLVQVAAVTVAALVPAVAVRLLLAATMGVLVAQGAAVVAGLAALVLSAALLRRLVALAS